MREVDEEARGRIANVVRSIELLKCDVGAMGEVQEAVETDFAKFDYGGL